MQSYCDEPIRIGQIMGKCAYGGIRSVLFNRYSAIDKSKVQFDFFVDEGTISQEDRALLIDQGAKVFEMPPVSDFRRYSKAFIDVFKNEGYIVVHAYLNTLNVFPLRAALVAGVPVRISENLSTAHNKELKTLAKQVLKPLAKRYPTHFAANSCYSGEWLFGKSSVDQCEIIKNAIDLNRFGLDSKARDLMRKEMGWNDRFVVGNVGRFQPQKNQLFLLEVFNEITKADSSALLAFVGYGALEDAIRDKVDMLGLNGSVCFLEPSIDLPAFYNAIDCFALPSLYEGLPVVAIEAQSTSCPCVLSSEITPEAKVIDYCSYFSLSQSTREWAEGILACRSCLRHNQMSSLQAAGYDLKLLGKQLEGYYLRLYGEQVG